MIDLGPLRRAAERAGTPWRTNGRLVRVVGELLEAELPGVEVGAVCKVGGAVPCEVVGFRRQLAVLMPLGPLPGLSYGATVSVEAPALRIPTALSLRGRVIDGLGRPLDGGPPPLGAPRLLRGAAPSALERPRINRPLATGVRALDGLMTLGRGQRVGIVAGSGVGKSTLLGMLARNVDSDANVICLVGERGREVRGFLEDALGPEGLARSCVVVATAERSAAEQVAAVLAATSIAEAWRDRGMDVVLMVDSLTRLAIAQRQIGLAAGEPPTTRGYTPSVFQLIPGLLERAGAAAQGTITGLYTVLVEADDIHDPVADAVRGVADGHIVLSRRLASHGHYPAIDVLGSLSRLMSRLAEGQHATDAARFRRNLAVWDENEELIRLGAYRAGSSAEVDEAMRLRPQLNRFLLQGADECSPVSETLAALAAAVS